MNPFKLSLLGALALSVGACTFINYASSDYFILKGTLEPHTGLELSPQYRPAEGNNCTLTPFSTGQKEAMKGAGWRNIEIKPTDTNQTFEEKIPLAVTVKGCKFEFDRVYTVISYDSPERIVPHTKTMNFLWTDTLESIKKTKENVNAINCSWLFKIQSNGQHPNTDIHRYLNCTTLSKDTETKSNITSKQIVPTFIMNVHISKKEEPSCKGCWIKVSTGWKSCVNEHNPYTDGSCETPPKFRTFKHKGKTCTVYPSCTE